MTDKKPKLTAKKIKPINLPDRSSLLFDSSERILSEFLIDNLREAEEEFIQQIQNKLGKSEKCAKLHFKIFYTVQIEQIPQYPNNPYNTPRFEIVAKPHSAEQALQLMEIYKEEYKDCIKQIKDVTEE